MQIKINKLASAYITRLKHCQWSIYIIPADTLKLPVEIYNFFHYYVVHQYA